MAGPERRPRRSIWERVKRLLQGPGAPPPPPPPPDPPDDEPALVGAGPPRTPPPAGAAAVDLPEEPHGVDARGRPDA